MVDVTCVRDDLLTGLVPRTAAAADGHEPRVDGVVERPAAHVRLRVLDDGAAVAAAELCPVGVAGVGRVRVGDGVGVVVAQGGGGRDGDEDDEKEDDAGAHAF